MAKSSFIGHKSPFLNKFYTFIGMKMILCTLSFFILFQGFGQTTPEDEKKIDSLKLIVHSAQHDTLRIKALIEWDNIIYLSDVELDLQLIKNSLFKNAGLPVEQQKEKLETAFEGWKSNLEQIDDVCIIGVRL